MVRLAAELSCDAWFSDPRLRAAVSATGRLALARGGELAVFAPRAGRPESRVACLWPIGRIGSARLRRRSSRSRRSRGRATTARGARTARAARERHGRGCRYARTSRDGRHPRRRRRSCSPSDSTARRCCSWRPRAAAGVGAEHATALWVLYRGGIIVAVHQLDGVAGRYWRAGSGGDDGERRPALLQVRARGHGRRAGRRGLARRGARPRATARRGSSSTRRLPSATVARRCSARAASRLAGSGTD